MKKPNLRLCLALTLAITLCACGEPGVTQAQLDEAAANAKSGQRESRKLTSDELNNFVVATSKYLFEGKRGEQKGELPKFLTLKDNNGFDKSYTILPTSSLTENDLLLLANETYGKQLEVYTPKSGDLSFDEAKAHAVRVVKDNKLELADKYEVYGYSFSGTGEAACWTMSVVGENGNNYFVRLFGPSAASYMLYRLDEGCYSPGRNKINPPVGYSDEELMAAAQQHYAKISDEAVQCSIDKTGNTDSELSDEAAGVILQSEDKRILINVSLSDLAICGINYDANTN